MPSEIVYIHSNDPLIVSDNYPGDLRIFEEVENSVIVVYEQGPQGAHGNGIVSREPFYEIVSGRLYETTSSISFLNTISSSLIPYTSSLYSGTSFTLGSTISPWSKIFLDTGSSIFFTAGGQIYASMSAQLNKVYVGRVVLSNESIGIDDVPIIIRNGVSDIKVQYSGSYEVTGNGSRTIHSVKSGSFEAVKVGEAGILTLGNFTSFPGAVSGGIIYYGSDMYIGT